MFLVCGACVWRGVHLCADAEVVVAVENSGSLECMSRSLNVQHIRLPGMSVRSTSLHFTGANRFKHRNVTVIGRGDDRCSRAGSSQLVPSFVGRGLTGVDSTRHITPFPALLLGCKRSVVSDYGMLCREYTLTPHEYTPPRDAAWGGMPRHGVPFRPQQHSVGMQDLRRSPWHALA